ncbi:unnamed protein product [Vitrella brassicaformis CCMP3155]|uniref:tRNA/rRNA methyltransferase SpoU type domain-containing protein n=1 Tax=Vitrella brassicaformis (strain CCMP3155) TaxID=1169540 RepID=A0A0G4FJF5_VITBC|nr:unnamed protein product [Vitrella brassicaformis CCMP3155]|mmetsp:Transcript_40648/g.115863  ORF Transcript_40648/g.115863 Transcript_40648/m.115863 type:complete len:363 (+) Transcript_40648:82-1170(+)|eukprot:CEM13751.1 unnamed protein product [Vitrella brassicaformis CCMP3155]
MKSSDAANSTCHAPADGEERAANGCADPPGLVNHEVVVIATADDERVELYKMKKGRNELVYSAKRREMFDRGMNYVVAMSDKATRRAFQGKQRCLSVLVSLELFESLRDDLEALSLDGPVLTCPRALISEIVGMPLNHDHAIGALFDLQGSQIADYPMAGERSERSVKRPSIRDGTAAEKALGQRIKEWEQRVDLILANMRPPFLVLADVRSADNVGTLLRTAFSFGLRSIVMTDVSWAGCNARAARVSIGSLFHFDICHCPEATLPRVIQQMKQMGITVYGTSPCANEFLHGHDDDNWAAVVGNEDTGASDAVLSACTEVVSIPQMAGDSLTVSHAAAIALYELTKTSLKRQLRGGEGCAG